jgi:DNA-binding SARP family transcriptional activator
MWHLELRLLGRPWVIIDSDDRTTEIGDKSLALVAYVALAAPQRIARGKLAGTFWPDKSENASLYRLRHALWDLRRIIGKAHLQADDANCWLALEDDVRVDVLEFQRGCEDLTRAGVTQLSALAELYRGDLLDGVVVREAPLFDEWLLVERERLQLLYHETLWRLAQAQQAAEDYARAAQTLARLIQADPLHERGYRALMGGYLRQGDRAAALRVYAQCAKTLAAELGISPSPATTLLREMIARGTPASAENEVKRATVLLAQKRYSDAWATCAAIEAAVADPITRSQAALLRAEIALSQGKQTESLTLIQTAREAIRNMFSR